jgi:hypothetical protein
MKGWPNWEIRKAPRRDKERKQCKRKHKPTGEHCFVRLALGGSTDLPIRG